MYMKRKKCLNISLLGDTCVGKTCIVNSFIGNEFTETLKTFGIIENIIKKTFDNSEYKFKIFDTAGEKKYRSISNSTIQIADGFFLVFSVDNKESFEKAISWIESIEWNYDLEGKVIYLLENKIDVEPEKKQVTKEEVEVFAKRKNFKYFETSARSGKGINEAFEEMFKDVYEKYKMNKDKTDCLHNINKGDKKKKFKNHCLNAEN